ncbi:MAG: serine/threonine protein kinase [Phycisphaerae bacterium]|nr:serine/threonine protein kinase [Phycisphaerae bacterium]
MGKRLAVRGYEILEYLGSGARSTIWKIRQRDSGELRALKRVVKRHNADDRFITQALNEYEIAGRLGHPHLRAVHELRRIRRSLRLREVHMIMEFCPGLTVQDNRPERVEAVVAIFEQVAAGLAHMNAAGFVHADTKPNNILVAPDGTAKIIDFGQSCSLGTVKQRVQGTPDYIAPEQVARRPLDGRTDVFNFGAALYWTLTGRPIPTTLPKDGALQFKDDLAATPADQLNPDVPHALSKLVDDCIAFEPAQRIASMKDVASRLGLIGHKLRRDARNGAAAT